MKVVGFTFIRNAVKYDYPFTEAVKSILPLCDEVVINMGNSDDGTETLVRSISTDKIRLYHSVWDDSLLQGGKVLAIETDKALRHVPADADWCIYIQGDEVIHERFYPAIRTAMEKYADDQRVEGLLFSYTHFYGSYDYIGDTRKWYDHEIRIIRNDPAISSYRDAQGFRKNGRKLQVKKIDASIYHYGWVRHPRFQMQKILGFEKLYDVNDLASKISREASEQFDYSGIESLTRFTGTHPRVMQDRISRQNWTFDHDITRKNLSLKGKLLLWMEKLTGKAILRLSELPDHPITSGIAALRLLRK